MNYKAMISDIDGTLGPVSLKPLPSSAVKQAIKKAVSQGFLFTIATGKPLSLVEYLIDDLQLTSPIIIDNGAAIYNPITRKKIIEHIIETQEAQKILELVRQYSNEYRVSCSDENMKNILHINKDYRVRKFVVLDLSIINATALVKKVESQFKNLHVVQTSSDLGKQYNAVYISSAQATKQHAVVEVARILGILPKEIIGIGDHYNDFPLLMACGLKIAMGNAVPELKAIADYVAPSVENDGLVDVLENFVLNMKPYAPNAG